MDIDRKIKENCKTDGIIRCVMSYKPCMSNIRFLYKDNKRKYNYMKNSSYEIFRNKTKTMKN